MTATSVEVVLRNDPRIRHWLDLARFDRDEAIRERHPEVKRVQRDRARLYVKAARIRLHSLIRGAVSP